MKKTLCVLAAASALLTTGLPLHADVRIWTGAGINNDFTNLANWDTGVPQSGDSITFARGARNTATAANATTLTLSSITFETSAVDDLAFTYNLGTNSIFSLTGKLLDRSGNGTLTPPNATGYRHGIRKETSFITGGTLALGAAQEIESTLNSHLRINSNITGTSFTKTGGGWLTLNGDISTLTSIRVEAGYLRFTGSAKPLPHLYLAAGSILAWTSSSHRITSLEGYGSISTDNATHQGDSYRVTIDNTNDILFHGSFIANLPESLPQPPQRSTSLEKRGSGRLTLTGVSTHFLGTLVSNGILEINGADINHKASFERSAITLQSSRLEIGAFGAAKNGVLVTATPAETEAYEATINNAGEIIGAINNGAGSHLTLINSGTITGNLIVGEGATTVLENSGTITGLLVRGNAAEFRIKSGQFTHQSGNLNSVANFKLAVDKGASFTTPGNLQVGNGAVLTAHGTVSIGGTLFFNGGEDFVSTLELGLQDNSPITARILTLETNASVRLLLSMSSTADLEDVFTLATYTGKGNGSGKFVSVNGVAIDENMQFSLTYGSNLYTMELTHGTTALTATVLNIEVIPEPSTWLLLGSSMITLTFLRHRRRKHYSLTQ